MLVNLTPNEEQIKIYKQIAQDEHFDYTPQADPEWLQETGIYQASCPHNFRKEEFKEKLKEYDLENLGAKNEFGVADDIGQIKKYYEHQINDKSHKYIIAVTPVGQNKGEKGGWRWHKWGPYIGNLKPQHEYLDDEDFGESFEYILCFNLYEVISS